MALPRTFVTYGTAEKVANKWLAWCSMVTVLFHFLVAMWLSAIVVWHGSAMPYRTSFTTRKDRTTWSSVSTTTWLA